MVNDPLSDGARKQALEAWRTKRRISWRERGESWRERGESWRDGLRGRLFLGLWGPDGREGIRGRRRHR